MNTEMSTALMLMAVGMITVFAILMVVYIVGTLIISVTNKLYKEKVPVIAPVIAQQSSITPQKLSAIITAVGISTLGKGTVTSIQKIK